MFEEDYSVMVRVGKSTDPEQDKLEYDKMYDHFMNKCGGINYKASINLVKEISALSTKITITDQTLEMLTLAYHETLIKILNEYGYRQKFPKEDIPQFKRDWFAVDNRNNALKLRLALRENDLQEIISKSGDASDMTADNYIDLIWDVAIAFKFHIDIRKLVVDDLIILMLKYREHVQRLIRNSKPNRNA